MISAESPADLSTSAINSGSRPALTQPMGRFAYRRAGRFDGVVNIIEHRESFEIASGTARMATRRLATILAADVASFSAMMERDEGTHGS